jgi:hypothetical protein
MADNTLKFVCFTLLLPIRTVCTIGLAVVASVTILFCSIASILHVLFLWNNIGKICSNIRSVVVSMHKHAELWVVSDPPPHIFAEECPFDNTISGVLFRAWACDPNVVVKDRDPFIFRVLWSLFALVRMILLPAVIILCSAAHTLHSYIIVCSRATNNLIRLLLFPFEIVADSAQPPIPEIVDSNSFMHSTGQSEVFTTTEGKQ